MNRVITLLLCFFGITSATLHAQLPLAWANSMGGGLGNGDAGMSVAVDAAGNVYTAGIFKETSDFDPGPGTFTLTAAGNFDIFITKMDENGNLLWAKSIGGASDDRCTYLVLDDQGNIYLTGRFAQTVDFDPGAGSYDLVSSGFSEAYIVKLDSNGDFVWAKSLGGTGAFYDTGTSLAVDGAGNIVILGMFGGTGDLDPGAGAQNATSHGFFDIFILKLDPNGDFIWVKYFGGLSWDHGNSIDIDGQGNIYTTGVFDSTVDFDPGPGQFNLTSQGTREIYVSKMDENGNFLWAKQLGGNSADEGFAIKVDHAGNVYSTGRFIGLADFNPGLDTFHLNAVMSSDVYLSKLDANGDFLWAKSIVGGSQDLGYSMALDNDGYLYTTGFFKLTADFDPGPDTFNMTALGNEDMFILKLDTDGNFIWAERIGGPQIDKAFSIDIDASGHIFASGSYAGDVDFDPGPGTSILSGGALSHVFVVKFADPTVSAPQPNGTPTQHIYPNPTSGHFTLEIQEPAQIAAYNAMGQLVYQKEVLGTLSQHDLSVLPNGAYYLQIINQQNFIIKKLLISH